MSPWALLAGLAGLAVAFGAGWGVASTYRDGLDAEAALTQSEANREIERTAARDRTAKLDRYTAALQAEQALVLAAAGSAQRVRDEANRIASNTGPGACQPERETIASLAQLLAEGAGLVEEGRRFLGDCRPAREALTDSDGRPRMDR